MLFLFFLSPTRIKKKLKITEKKRGKRVVVCVCSFFFFTEFPHKPKKPCCFFAFSTKRRKTKNTLSFTENRIPPSKFLIKNNFHLIQNNFFFFKQQPTTTTTTNNNKQQQQQQQQKRKCSINNNNPGISKPTLSPLVHLSLSPKSTKPPSPPAPTFSPISSPEPPPQHRQYMVSSIDPHTLNTPF